MARVEDILDFQAHGLPMPDDLLRQIVEGGFADEIKDSFKDEGEAAGPMYDGRRHLWLYRTPPSTEDNPEIGDDPNYYDRIPTEWVKEWEGRTITPFDFTPKDCPENIPRAMHEWVMSSWDRFDQMVAYKEFWLYCEQARRWNEETLSAEDFPRYSQEWIEYCLQEVDRCAVNHLYALDRYVTIKDDTQPGGRRKYKASTPQAMLAYLKNMKVSYIIIKGRQAAVTSSEMAMAQIRSKVMKSYKGVIVTDDVEITGKNIFEDKFMSTAKHMPWWFQPKKVAYSSTLRVMYDFESGKGKGMSRMTTAEMGVLSSKDTQTINGTTPTDLYVDEGQNIATLQKIVDERRPTQLAEVGGKMRLVRQTFIYGTGSSHDKGKGAMEDEYRATKALMQMSKNTRGWIAIFFDAFCRPYMSKEIYFSEYWRYVGDEHAETKGRTVEEKQAMFCSHYPMNDEDAFRGATRGVASYAYVKKNMDRISKMYPEGPTPGYFVPIYDHNRPMPKGSFCDWYIVGVTFERAKPGDLNAPVWMFKDRELGWLENYWQATDPIQSDTGMSLMGSVIMASAATTREEGGRMMYVPAPVCIMNHRTPIVKQTFLQTKLMGMYYANSGQRACPELVEYNQGHNYIEFCKSPFVMCEDSLVFRAELGPGYSVGNHLHGVLMNDDVKTRAHMDLAEFNSTLGGNVWFRQYFAQLKNIEQDESGKKIKWGTADVRRHNDDLVIAMVLAYVLMKTRGAGNPPRRIGSAQAPVSETVWVRQQLPDYTWMWVEREQPVEYAHA